MNNPEIDKFGDKRWFNEKGQLHRVDGPAIERVSGTKVWYLNGKCHRETGPAVEYGNGDKYWYLNDEMLSFEEWQTQVIIQNAKSLVNNF